MRISRIISCAALAALITTAATPAPAAAQIGGFLKRKLKEKVVQAVVGSDSAAAAGKGAPTASAEPKSRFTENVLEMTPELLDRVEKGVAAESLVQDEVDRLLGKVLSPDEYERCEKAVRTSPEGQQISMEVGELIPDDATPEQLQKVGQEGVRRFARIIKAKCGLQPQEAQQVRAQHADRLRTAGPTASGLTKLQLSILKERIIPFCTAARLAAASAGEVRIPTSSQTIFWVYTAAEQQALQPRCAKLASALRRGA